MLPMSVFYAECFPTPGTHPCAGVGADGRRLQHPQGRPPLDQRNVSWGRWAHVAGDAVGLGPCTAAWAARGERGTSWLVAADRHAGFDSPLLAPLICSPPRRYGYSYGCAAADVWHLVHHTAMLYPGYEVLGRAGVVAWWGQAGLLAALDALLGDPLSAHLPPPHLCFRLAPPPSRAAQSAALRPAVAGAGHAVLI